MNIIIGEIRVKRGNKANLPVLKPGEPAFCEDTQEYVVGSPNGNIFFPAGGSSGGGGSVPSNVILFEDWVDGETVTIDTSTTPPADTTAPILTITAGGTFTGTKTVTLSVNETADIFYTLDGSTPTTSSAKYTGPLSISATTTLKAFARDTAGNVSTVQTVTYTLDTTTPADTIAPNNVTNLQATPTANSVALSWTASSSSDVASYDIYNGSTLIANVTGTSYNVTGLTASTAYTFSVRAKDGANNVASGTSVNTTTLTPADTTEPTLTITPATTFSTTQNVTMTTDDPGAKIYYTLDDSDPKTSATKIEYTASLTLTETDTVKAYAVDTAGNATVVQTVTYTKETALSNPALSMNGSSNYIQLPSLTFDEIQMEVFPQQQSGVSGFFLDGRTNSTIYMSNNTSGNWDNFGVTSYQDGALITNLSAVNTWSKRVTLKATLNASVTDDLTFFAHNNKTQGFLKGIVYKIKVLLAGNVVALYDFTQQFSGSVITDGSGNGNNATLNGGTWISDPSPKTTTTSTPYYISLDGTDDKLSVPVPVNTKYVELKLSRQNNDIEGYVFDMRAGNTVYSASASGAFAGYNGFTVDGVSKTIAAANASTDLPNNTVVTLKYTLTSVAKSGNMTIGSRYTSATAPDWHTLNVYDIKFYDASNNLIEDFDFNVGAGTTLYGSSGLNGTITGGTWVAA